MTVDLGRYRALLVQERERVVAAIDYLHKENPGSMKDEVDESAALDSPAETASVTIDREIDYTLEENSAEILRAIDAALHRLDEGAYGRCESCGQPIEDERLAAIPWTTLCIDDKRVEERGLSR